VLGQLLLATGQAGQGRQVLTAAHAAAVKIGQDDLAGQISKLLGRAGRPAEGT